MAAEQAKATDRGGAETLIGKRIPKIDAPMKATGKARASIKSCQRSERPPGFFPLPANPSNVFRLAVQKARAASTTTLAKRTSGV